MTTQGISEADEWSTDGPNLLTPENLALLKHVADDVAPVIVEHWHYRRSTAPHRFVFDSYDELEQYIQQEGLAGDIFYMWNFTDCCRENNGLVSGKIPDAAGRVPKRGAY